MQTKLGYKSNRYTLSMSLKKENKYGESISRIQSLLRSDKEVFPQPPSLKSMLKRQS